MNKWAVHFEPGVFRSSCATVCNESCELRPCRVKEERPTHTAPSAS